MSDEDVGGNEVFYGTVIWFNAERGIGFLLWERDGEDQADMFIHYSDINISGFKTLKKDQQVSFSIGVNHHGQPKGINVTPLS